MREGRRVIALAQHAGGATFAEVVAALSGETRASFKPSPRKRDLDAEDDDVRRRRDTARWLWAQREPLGVPSRKRTSGRRAATEGRYRPRWAS
jgi:hypothetical protein